VNSSSGAPSQIQPPIVERERRIIGRSLLRQAFNKLRTQFIRGQIFQMAPKDDVANEFAILIGVLQQSRRGFERRFHFNESRTFERRCGAFRILKEPGLTKAGKVCGKLRRRRQRVGPRSKTRNIRAAAALRLQPSTRKQRIVKVRKQLVVIEHPMESGCTDDAVEGVLEGQVQEIADYKTKAILKLRRQMWRAVWSMFRERSMPTT
jgi:hypothetical protein